MAASLERTELVEKAAVHLQRGDLDKALSNYEVLFKRDPRDWNIANTLGDLYVRLGRSADAVEHFSALAERLASDGFTAKARALYRKILRIQPRNELARARVDELEQVGGEASPFLQRVLQTARSARTTPAPPVVDPEPVAAKAAVVTEPPLIPVSTVAPPPAAAAEELSVWRAQPSDTVASDEWQSLSISDSTPAAPPEPHPAIAPPPAAPVRVEVEVESPAPVAIDPFRETEMLVEAALARREFVVAASALEQFLASRPHHIAALERLIDVGVDGRLENTLATAQVQLAEACLEEGEYERARDIAVDLIFRAPSATPYQSLLDRVMAAARGRGRAIRIVPPEVMTPAEAPEAVEPPVTSAVAAREPALASALPIVEAPRSHDDLPPDLREWSDTEQAFDDLRSTWLEEAAAAAEERFASAATLIEANQFEQAARALEEAMCAPHLRAPAGGRLARLYRDLGDPMEALSCLEWVAEVPPASQDHGHELAYELAVTLEALGQQDQALGIYRELLAEVGPSYRDIAVRTKRIAAA